MEKEDEVEKGGADEYPKMEGPCQPSMQNLCLLDQQICSRPSKDS